MVYIELKGSKTVDKSKRKELIEQYKSKKATGGIYCIKCNANNKTWLRAARDMEGQKNRFEFFFSTNSCPEPSMLPEWKQYGAKTFSFEVLEELKQGETQTDKEFADDLEILLKIWLEKQQA